MTVGLGRAVGVDLCPGLIECLPTDETDTSLVLKPDGSGGLVWTTDSAGSGTFLGLTDTPASYSGQGTDLVRVNAGETALEFITTATLAGSLQHHDLLGLGDDDHTQYLLLAGRAGGQTAIGGTASGEDLTLQSTSNATKGSVFLGAAQSSAYDEVNDRLGVGTNVPDVRFHAFRDNSFGTPDSSAIAVFEDSGSAIVEILGQSEGLAKLQLSDDTGNDLAHVRYDTGNLILNRDGDAIWVDADQDVGIGDNSPDVRLSVKDTIADTVGLVNLETTGTNGGVAQIHVGSRTPEGNVPADGGALYLRDDGASSALYVKTSDGVATGWVDLNTVGTGDVVGPGSATDNALARFDGTTGKLIQNSVATLLDTGKMKLTIGGGSGATAPTNSDGFVIDGNANSGFAILSGNASLGRITFGDSDDGSRGEISYDHTDDSMRFSTGNDTEAIVIDSSQNVLIGTGNPSARLHVKDTVADTDPIARLETTGSNGAGIDIHTGTRDPNTNVTGSSGDLYVRKNGTSPQLWQNDDAVSGTSWTQISGGGSVTAEEGDLFADPAIRPVDSGSGTQTNFNGNMKGALFYNNKERTFNNVILHTGVSWSGTHTMRCCIWQASDGAFDGNFDLLFSETIDRTAVGTNTTFAMATSGGDLTLKQGYYVLACGRNSGTGSPFLTAFFTPNIDIYTRFLNNGPAMYNDLGSASSPADPITPTSETASTADDAPVHKLRLI